MVKELQQESIAISLACKTLEVSRTGYYDWCDRPESERSLENRVLITQIEAVHHQSRKTYGSPRVHAKLVSEGVECGENRVAKLMKQNDIVSVVSKKFKVSTTDSNHDLPIAPRVFETENAHAIMAPNQVWVGDISYIPTKEGFLFLAIFLDVFTRKIVGFSTDDNMRTELIMNALQMAIKRQEPQDGELIAHSDRGSQYASGDFTAKLKLLGIIASMSRKGNCYDNAFAETFFHTLKTELVYQTTFATREEARQAIFEYIETWYNRERLHSSLGFMTPEEYEKLALVS